MPAATSSSTAYWISGLSTMGSISLGMALVAGRKRVPIPATGNTALRIGFIGGGGFWVGPAGWASAYDLPRRQRGIQSVGRLVVLLERTRVASLFAERDAEKALAVA